MTFGTKCVKWDDRSLWTPKVTYQRASSLPPPTVAGRQLTESLVGAYSVFDLDPHDCHPKLKVAFANQRIVEQDISSLITFYSSQLKVVLQVQGLIFFVGLLLELWYFRWHNFLATLIGFGSMFLGFWGHEMSGGSARERYEMGDTFIAGTRSTRLKWYVLSQGVGCIFVVVSILSTYIHIANYKIDCRGRTDCVSVGLLFIIAAQLPTQFGILFLGGLYGMRVANLAVLWAVFKEWEWSAEQNEWDTDQETEAGEGSKVTLDEAIREKKSTNNEVPKEAGVTERILGVGYGSTDQTQLGNKVAGKVVDPTEVSLQVQHSTYETVVRRPTA